MPPVFNLFTHLMPLITFTGHLLRYLSVFAGSSVKFLMGPVTGISSGLSVFETVVLTTSGAMLTVTVLSSIGPNTRKRLLSRFTKKRSRLFSSRNRKLVRLWRRYGLFGVAFLMPILLSPVVGSLVAISFGEKQRRIIYYMFISSLAWAMLISVFIRYMVDLGKAIV